MSKDFIGESCLVVPARKVNPLTGHCDCIGSGWRSRSLWWLSTGHESPEKQSCQVLGLVWEMFVSSVRCWLLSHCSFMLCTLDQPLSALRGVVIRVFPRHGMFHPWWGIWGAITGKRWLVQQIPYCQVQRSGRLKIGCLCWLGSMGCESSNASGIWIGT